MGNSIPIMSLLTLVLDLTNSTGFIVSVCVIGAIICLYAIKVESVGFAEKKKYGKPQYKQICDVNESMSCTLVLTSKYSHMAKLMFNLNDNSIFNYSNAQYGLLFYISLLIFQFYPFTMIPYHNIIFLCLTLSSILASMGLAWILYSILMNFCMICVCMYIVNTLLCLSAIAHLIKM